MERPGNDPMPSDADNPVNITLPDGSVRTFDGAVTGRAVAEDIGPGLAKAALAVRVDGVAIGDPRRGGNAARRTPTPRRPHFERTEARGPERKTGRQLLFCRSTYSAPR